MKTFNVLLSKRQTLLGVTVAAVLSLTTVPLKASVFTLSALGVWHEMQAKKTPSLPDSLQTPVQAGANPLRAHLNRAITQPDTSANADMRNAWNVIYLELVGSSVTASLNYERFFINNLSIRASIPYFYGVGPMLGVTSNIPLGRGDVYLSVGVTAACFAGYKYFFGYHQTNIALRMLPKKGGFHMALTFAILNATHFDDKINPVSLGLSLGWAF